MKQRIITALILIAIVVPIAYFGGYYFEALIAVVAALSGYEMIHILNRPKASIYLFFIVIPYLVCAVLYQSEILFINNYFVFIYSCVMFILTILDENFTLDRCTYFISMGILIGCGLHCLITIRNTYGLEYLLILAIANYGSDTGAYFAGYFLGKNKLIPRLSPNKTVEGSIGGILFGTILAVLFAYCTHVLNHNLILILAIFVLTITSQFGDLIFSSIKRTFGVKDYSNLLPGHGGILDRVDSLVFNAIIFSFFLVLVRL